MDKWFSPLRVMTLLGAAIILLFPKVIAGIDTMIYRDFGVLGYPFLFYYHESFWRGELPFWNPLSNCGAPFLAQWGTMVLYPFSLFYLLLPMPWSVNLFGLAHMALGGAGMYRLARAWTQHPFAAAFASLAFVFSGLHFSCMIWPNYLVAIGWMPWVVLSAERASLTGGTRVIIASLVGALQMLAGVPEIAVLTWLFIGSLFVTEVVRQRTIAHLVAGRLVGIVLIVAGLIAVQLLPFLDLLNQSQRSDGFATSKWALPLWGAGNFLVPLFHSYQNHQGIFFQAGQEFFSSVYLGIISVVLGCYAILRVRNSRVWLLGGLTVFCVVMALGDDGLLFTSLKKVIPGLGLARYPVKFLLLPAFAVPLLAAFAIAQLHAHLPDPNRARGEFLTLFVLVGLALAGIGGVLFVAYRFPFPLDQWTATWHSAVERAAVLLAGVGLLILGIRASLRTRFWAGLGVLFLVVIDLLTHAPAQNPTITTDALAPGLWELSQKIEAPAFGNSRVMIRPEAEQALLMSRVRDIHKDFLGKRLALWSNLNLLDRIPKVNGSSTLQVREQMQLQSVLYQSTNEFPHLMDLLGVSLATAPSSVLEWKPRATFLPLITAGQKPIFADPAGTLQALTNTSFDPRTAVYLPLEARSIIVITNTTSPILGHREITPHRIAVTSQSPEPCVIVVAQSYYNAWQAFIDDQPTKIWRANYAFQAVHVPAGTHRITWTYRDRKFTLGALISGSTLALCVLALLRHLKTHDATIHH